LVELHVLGALRRHHGLSLQKIRQALHYLRRRYPRTRHPLADHDLLTDGLDLWVRDLDALVAASRHGQLGIREVLEAHLRRVDRSPSGLALRLYPFTRAAEPDEPRAVVIDPAVAFGRPTLVGTGIPTAVIGDRYKAGESIEELAEDYHRSPEEINEAIRCELWTRAA
jgi:uncharacterized protein (DUF433 family)